MLLESEPSPLSPTTPGAELHTLPDAVYRAVVDRVGLAIVLTDFESRPFYFNDAFRQLFGYSDEDWETHTVIGCSHPDDLATHERMLAQLRDGTIDSYVLRKRYVRKDGSIFGAQLGAVRLAASRSHPACVAAIIRDVSDLVAAEANAGRHARISDRIAALTPASMFVIDLASGAPVYLNARGRAMLKAMGVSAGQLTEDLLRAALHPDDVERAIVQTRELATLRDEEVRESEWRVKDGVGGWRTIQRRDTALARDADGKATQVVATVLDVTETRDEAERLRLLSRVTEQAQVSIVITNTFGEIVFVNPNFEKVTGYASAEVLGRNPRFLASGETPRARYVELWETILEGRTWIGDLRNRRKDGSLYWERATITGVLDEHGLLTHFMAVKEDITDRRAADDELAHRAQQLAEVQELALVGAWRMALPSGEVWRSDAFYRVFHVTPTSMPESLDGFLSRVAPDDQEPFRTAFADCLAGNEVVDSTVRLTGDDHVERCARVSARPERDANGVLTGLVGAVQDVTRLDTARRSLETLNAELEARVEARTAALEASEQELREQADELSAVNTELARAAQAKDAFLASMSHELRTPLTGVLNLSEAMQEGAFGDVSPEQAGILQTVQDAGRHLLTLINDILDLSKIEAGQFTLRIEECHANDLARASGQLVKGTFARCQQHFTLDLPDVPVLLDADARRMKQILVNLLSNASKFTPHGGHITLRLEADAERREVRFSVADDGMGIAREDFPKLFQPFTQLDNSLSRRHEGTGLGLALVSRMVEMHGGSVHLDSGVGHGSVFTVILPWRTHAGTAATASVEAAPGATPARGELILIVDDNDTNLMALSRYLQSRGYRAILARNGAQALQMASASHPNLVLMDIQMPELDGLEATRRLRALTDPVVATVPVIALTALVMPGDRETCLAAGANDYVSKPARLPELLAVIDRWVRRDGTSPSALTGPASSAHLPGAERG